MGRTDPVDDLLEALAARGISVEVTARDLLFRPPLPLDLREAVRAHARDLALALLPPRTPCTCGCRWYWRIPGRRWRCWRCDFAEVPDDPETEVESVLCDDGVIRRPRPPQPQRLRCGVCGATYAESADGASWIPSLAGGSWPRCPDCTARGRTPDPPARPRRARGG
jgi:hypothetical protein